MFEMLFTVTAFIGIVLLIRCIGKNHISARMRYALWLLVAVKLLVFPMPGVEGYFSVLRLVTDGEDRALLGVEISGEDLTAAEISGQASEASREEPIANGNLRGADDQAGDQTTQGMIVSGTDAGAEPEFVNVDGSGSSKWERRQQILKLRLQNYTKNVWRAPVWLIFVWGAGSLACVFMIVIYHLRLQSCLRKNRVELESGRLFSEMREDCREGIKEKGAGIADLKREEAAGNGRRLLAVYSIEGLPTPCLFGKSIYIPARLAEDDKILPYVLRHEMCHYFHGDPVWGFMRIVCVCLYWFHPLVWLAAYLSRQDCELACDEAVVWGMTGTDRKHYGELLLEFALVKSSPADCFSITTAMSGNAKNLRERLCRITGRKKNRLMFGIFAILFGVAGIFACITSGSVSIDRQWQYIQITEQEESLPLQGSYEAEYRLSPGAVSYGIYIETYGYGDLISAEVLDCMTLLPERKQTGKGKRGTVTFSRSVETDTVSGVCLKAACSYSMPDYSASDGASSELKAFTLVLPENCIGNSFGFSMADRNDNRFRMNEDIILTADYYGDTTGLSVPAGHSLAVEKYMEAAGEEVIKRNRCVILTHLIVSDKTPEELEKQLQTLVKEKAERAAAGEIERNGDVSGKEESESAESVNGYSDEELIEMARNYYRQEHGFAPEHVEIDSENGNEVIIWLYDRDKFLNTDNEITGSARTGDWYTVDRMTGRGEDVLFEEIDLTRAGFISAPWDKTPDGMEVVDVREESSMNRIRD